MVKHLDNQIYELIMGPKVKIVTALGLAEETNANKLAYKHIIRAHWKLLNEIKLCHQG